MKVVEMTTGLFPDAPRVEEAVATLTRTHDVEKLDVSALDPNDDSAWEEIATAVLGADLIVTL
jgi:hypothetical protein